MKTKRKKRRKTRSRDRTVPRTRALHTLCFITTRSRRIRSRFQSLIYSWGTIHDALLSACFSSTKCFTSFRGKKSSFLPAKVDLLSHTSHAIFSCGPERESAFWSRRKQIKIKNSDFFEQRALESWTAYLAGCVFLWNTKTDFFVSSSFLFNFYLGACTWKRDASASTRRVTAWRSRNAETLFTFNIFCCCRKSVYYREKEEKRRTVK